MTKWWEKDLDYVSGAIACINQLNLPVFVTYTSSAYPQGFCWVSIGLLGKIEISEIFPSSREALAQLYFYLTDSQEHYNEVALKISEAWRSSG